MGRSLRVELDTNSVRDVKRAIARRSSAYTKELKKIVYSGALQIETKAKQNLKGHMASKSFPSIFKTLDGSIKSKIDPRMPSAEVVQDELPIGAYIEFGTGQYARDYLSTRPTDEKELAFEFFRSGKGTLRAFPYLFRAYYHYREEIFDKMRRAKI